jgi:hypothetical protein
MIWTIRSDVGDRIDRAMGCRDDVCAGWKVTYDEKGDRMQ